MGAGGGDRGGWLVSAHSGEFLQSCFVITMFSEKIIRHKEMKFWSDLNSKTMFD